MILLKAQQYPQRISYILVGAGLLFLAFNITYFLVFQQFQSDALLQRGSHLQYVLQSTLDTYRFISDNTELKSADAKKIALSLYDKSKKPVDATATPATINWSDRGLYPLQSNIFVSPYYGYLASHPNVCTPSAPYLLVFTISAASHVKNRSILRETYPLPPSIKRFFLIGLPVQNATYLTICIAGHHCSVNENLLRRVLRENDKYKDIIVYSYFDAYQLLEHKIAAGLQWQQKFCKNAKYVLKNDDDILPHWNNTLERLHIHDNITRTPYSVLGTHLQGGPVRNPNHRNTIPRNIYPADRFPVYPSGHSYILSSPAVAALIEMYKRIPAISIEDVYMGVMTTHMAIPVEPLKFPAHVHKRCAELTRACCIAQYAKAVEQWKQCSRKYES